jgi:glycosyltransferase involved in cell wall biosynthesis
MNFSVVIPLYNKEKHIQRAIRSVLAQTYQDFDLIIVDDGSTDASYKMASAIQDPRIRIIRQENQGVSAARNRGVAEARYDWVAFLDADDEWLPEFLQLLNGLHCQFRKCGLLATSFYKQRQNGFDYSEPENLVYPLNSKVLIGDFYTDLRKIGPFCCSSFAVSRSLLFSIGGFQTGLKLGEDLLVWLKLFQITPFAFANIPSAIYHLEADNRSLKPLSNLFVSPNNISFGDLFFNSMDWKKTSNAFHQSAIELLAMYEIPVIRNLQKEKFRAKAIKRLWRIRGTKVYREKWFKLFIKCLIPSEFLRLLSKLPSR